MNENTLVQKLSADLAANSITSVAFMFCMGNIYPQGEKDLELKLESSVLNPNFGRRLKPRQGTVNMLVHGINVPRCDARRF